MFLFDHDRRIDRKTTKKTSDLGRPRKKRYISHMRLVILLSTQV